MTDNPKEREKPAPPGKGNEERKEARGLGALRNVFGRMAFEKGPAYQDEPRKEDEDFGNREGLRRPTRRRVRRDKGPSGPSKPPEAFPGP